MSFELHPRLAAGGFDLGRLEGCRISLKNNALFPWLLLIPEVEAGVVDLHDLEEARYFEVMGAVRRLSEFVVEYFGCERVNVGCIGIKVPQMHIHVVGRSEGDAAWPETVWSFEGKEVYDPARAEEIRVALEAWLAGR